MYGINDIYFGNISAYDLKMPSNWHDARKRLQESNLILETMLSKEQLAILEKSQDLQTELFSIERRELFKYGVSVGFGIGFDLKE